MLHTVLALTLAFSSTDGSKISGTLSYPQKMSERMPVVVLVGSNGPQDRDERIGAIPVFALYAQALNAAGYAVLRYDNRGIGLSTTATREQSVRRQHFVDDAAAAIRAAASAGLVDSSNVFALGLSEGSETVMAAAIQGAPLRGLIFVGPLSVPYEVALAEQEKLAPPDAQANMQLRMALPYFQSYKGIDPRVEIADLQIPVLALRGTDDIQTLPAHFEGLVAAAKTAKRQFTAALMPGDDHFLLQLGPGEKAGALDYSKAHALDPYAISTILDWLRAHRAS